MSATPKDIALDINDLLVAGRRKMPDVADEYKAAAKIPTASTIISALSRDAELGIGEGYGILDEWRAARDAVIGMLEREEQTMRVIGWALEDIAIKEFQDADQSAKDKFVALYGKVPSDQHR